MALRVALLIALVLAPAAAVSAATVRGQVADPSGFPLPGVTVTLTDGSGASPLATITDASGTYACDLQPGVYHVTVELSGFMPATHDNVVVAGGETVTVDFQLAIAIQQEITVSADAPLPLLGGSQPNTPATVTREVIDNAMLPNSQYDDVLSLMPNVIRGQDGLISVAGARASQGALFVNGFNATDPVSGRPDALLPIESVDAVHEYSGGYPADLGRATGGVTSVQTRAGTDRFHMSADSFFPRLLFANGSTHGVEFWDPNMGVSGPIVKGRLFFEQGLSYRFDHNRFTTLAGPERNTFKALLSWTQLDLVLSPKQHAVATFSADPQQTNHANIVAFTPDTSVPAVDHGSWHAALADSVGVGASSLEIRGVVIRTQTTVTPDGSLPYDIGHGLLAGNYFDNQKRCGERVEAGVSDAIPASSNNLIKVGATAGYETFDDLDESAPIIMRRSDETISRVVSFMPVGAAHAATSEAGIFVQDEWTPRPRLTLDAGIRMDTFTAARRATWSPRAAWTIKVSQGLNLTGSAGVFSDKLPVGALAFSGFPARVIQDFDGSGAPAGPPVVYANEIGGPLNVPQAVHWDIGVDRSAGPWVVRAKYQERRGRDELVIDPAGTPPASALLLSSVGTSISKSLETTVGYRSGHAHDELYASYVRSTTRGDLNAFDAIEGVFKEPLVQANASGTLPTDVPDRLLAWGLVHLPSRMTTAAFIEVRDGFPFSAVDDNWLFAGVRDGHRLPWFGSVDLSMNKIVNLPRRLPDARVGLKLYNVLSVHTEREVQRDLDRPDFGQTYDPIPRDFTFVFELLWGHHG